MSREILFRAKRANWKELPKSEWWVKGYLMDENYINVPFNDYDVDGRFDEPIEIAPQTVCEYTGFNKNGREIFEGDIVKYHFGEDVAPIKFGTYQSCFDSQTTEHCGFYVDWKTERNFRKDLGYWVHMVDTEIVGNIFDNPELLESEVSDEINRCR